VSIFPVASDWYQSHSWDWWTAREGFYLTAAAEIWRQNGCRRDNREIYSAKNWNQKTKRKKTRKVKKAKHF